MTAQIDSNKHLPKISKFFYAGIFLISLCLLASEIILTRILSVIFWYHFAFLVVSVAIFGMTLGALIVYIVPKVFLPRLTLKHIASYAILSSFIIAVSFISLFYLPALFASLKISNWLLPALYILLALPFLTIGICLSLSLTRFPENIGNIYSINLLGSALGCISVIFILNNFNGPSAIFFIASLCALSALFFAYSANSNRLFKLSCIFIFLISLLFCLINQYSNSITPLWTKGVLRPARPIYSKWNFFSYVSVHKPSRRPFGWGFSPKISSVKINTNELMLLIDDGAGTVLTKFNDLRDLEYLKLDVSAIAYYLRNNDDVLILGSGGGRDLLTAVLFGAKRVVGVEINKDINYIAFDRLRDFSGSINKYKEIQRLTDEGRSYVSKSKEKYNLIQASLVDSFAAFANGAFALTENSLYTKEAWIIFLKHLKENGILSFSRWYDLNKPFEIYRLVTLAKSVLQDTGVREPGKNIALIRGGLFNGHMGIGTILLSKVPFSDSDLARLGKVCQDLGFELVLSPRGYSDENFNYIFKNPGPSYDLKNFPVNINPPTDNQPFFFYFAKFSDLFARRPAGQEVIILRKLLLTILNFGIIFILLPLLYKRYSETSVHGKISVNMVVYFVGIGTGFMLLEISLVQRLGIFLGHPIYGLTVVLFSLLLSCGLGSYLTKYINTKARVRLLFIILILMALVLMNAVGLITRIAASSLMPIKIALSVLILALLGIFMGMPFPVGMRLVGGDDSSRVLYWGLNGFSSVCGSVLAAVVLVNFGFQTCILTGIIFYLAALWAASLRSRT